MRLWLWFTTHHAYVSNITCVFLAHIGKMRYHFHNSFTESIDFQKRLGHGMSKDALAEHKEYRKYNKRSAGSKKLTAAVRSRLLEAWSWEWPDTKACEYAGISTKTLYHCMKTEANLRSARDLLRQTPSLVAKKNVAEAISDGDLRTSKWFLERRDADFSNKQQVDIQVTHSMVEADVAKELLAFIERNALIPGDKQDIIDITPADQQLPPAPEPADVDSDPLMA